MFSSNQLTTPAGTSSHITMARYFLPFIVILQYGYSFAFNYLPTMVRHGWAANVVLAIVVLAVLALSNRPKIWSVLTVSTCVILVVCWGLSSALGLKDVAAASRSGSWQDGLKIVSVYLAMIGIFSYAEVLPIRLLRFLAVGSIFIGGTIALIGNPIVKGGEETLASITGMTLGTDYAGPNPSLGFHDSAFFIVLNVFVVDQLYRFGLIKPRLAWFAIAFGILIALSYFSRTALIMLVAYYGYILYYLRGRNDTGRALLLSVAGLSVVGAIAYLAHNSDNILKLGSGRVGNYLHRWDVLSERGFDSLLLGTGLGSDAFVAPVWSWMVQNAHNDFLHIIVEAGFVGLGAIALFLLALYFRVSGPGRACFFALFASSAVSNGLLTHITMIIYLFLAMSVGLEITKRAKSPGIGSL